MVCVVYVMTNAPYYLTWPIQPVEPLIFELNLYAQGMFLRNHILQAAEFA